MSQILHIFRKDVRHLWIEILASLVILATYIWKTIHNWSVIDSNPDVPVVLQNTISALVPLSWCFLIVRAVQNESLMGDRQFWITRPYEWPKLMAAKAFFAEMFVGFPLFVTGVILLAAGGFSPIRYISGLLWIQLFLIMAVILPTAAVGAIASTIVQAVLWVLAIALYAAGTAYLSSVIPGSDMPLATDFAGTSSAVLCVGLSIAVLLIQYARRQIRKSLVLMLGAAVIVPLVVVATPYERLADRGFPPVKSGDVPPAQLAMLVEVPGVDAGMAPPFQGKDVDVDFPLQVSGVAPGYIVVEKGKRAAIEAPDGRRWASHWESEGGQIWPGQPRSSVIVSIPRKFFEGVHATPVNVQVSLALSLYRETDSRKIVAQAGEFQVPGVGRCWIDVQRTWDNSVITCHSPLQTPSLTARMETPDSTCPPSDNVAQDPALTKYSWEGNDETSPDFQINPIQDLTMSLQSWADESRKKASPGICPGTPLTISVPELTQNARVEVGLSGIHLQDYVPRFTRF